MKNLIPLVVLVSLFGCASYQKKVDEAKSHAKDAAEKVECRVKVLEPYLSYITSEQLTEFLEGADIGELLDAVEQSKAAVKQVKADFAACGKLF
jgi:hypothetical protein